MELSGHLSLQMTNHLLNFNATKMKFLHLFMKYLKAGIIYILIHSKFKSQYSTKSPLLRYLVNKGQQATYMIKATYILQFTLGSVSYKLQIDPQMLYSSLSSSAI